MGVRRSRWTPIPPPRGSTGSALDAPPRLPGEGAPSGLAAPAMPPRTHGWRPDCSSISTQTSSESWFVPQTSSFMAIRAKVDEADSVRRRYARRGASNQRRQPRGAQTMKSTGRGHHRWQAESGETSNPGTVLLLALSGSESGRPARRMGNSHGVDQGQLPAPVLTAEDHRCRCGDPLVLASDLVCLI